MERIEALELIAKSLLHGDVSGAKNLVNAEYPFHKLELSGRAYTDKQKIQQFKKDGFIDGYSG